MDGMVTALRSSLPDLSLSMTLYERLYDLPPLSPLAGRLRLPGIVFPLADLVPLPESDPESDLPGYRATTPMLGDVEIKTTNDLSGMEGYFSSIPGSVPSLTRISRVVQLSSIMPRAHCGSSCASDNHLEHCYLHPWRASNTNALRRIV